MTGAEIILRASLLGEHLAEAREQVRLAEDAGSEPAIVEKLKRAVVAWETERQTLKAAFEAYKRKLVAEHGEARAGLLIQIDQAIAKATPDEAERLTARRSTIAATGEEAAKGYAGPRPGLSQEGLVMLGPQVLRLKPEEAGIFKSQVAERWGKIIVENAQRTKVPAAMIAGLIWAESNGRPGIVSHDKGYGLMQLTHPAVFQGHQPQATIDSPALNVKLGTDLLKLLYSKGNTLPWAIASRYNAGSAPGGEPWPSSVAPWFVRATGTHILRVSAAYNEWKAGEQKAAAAGKSTERWWTVGMVGAGVIGLGLWWWSQGGAPGDGGGGG
jgi:soluble lytic murein transglycosylase-like protein